MSEKFFISLVKQSYFMYYRPVVEQTAKKNQVLLTFYSIRTHVSRQYKTQERKLDGLSKLYNQNLFLFDIWLRKNAPGSIRQIACFRRV